ncbi:MAG: hypothetical protein WC437_04450 [Patescibacteria group bacterium]
MKNLSQQIAIIIILTLTVVVAVYVYAAFIEPAVGPNSSDQDFSQNILGSNDANNDFSSSLVASNNDGSLIERMEYVINYLDSRRKADGASCSSSNECINNCLSGVCSSSKLVFATSASGNGKFSTWDYTNLDGRAGANEICNAIASTTGLHGTFVAWISTDATDAKDYITSQAYYNLNGVKIVDSLADLIDSSLDAAIDRDENNVSVPTDDAWTSTLPDGTRTAGSTCSDWSSQAPSPAIGKSGKPSEVNSGWTMYSNRACNTTHRLYCFEN